MFKRLKLRYFFTDRALCVLLITALALLYILASWLVTQENAKLSLDSPFSHLYIRGTYSVDGGQEKELREDTRFDLSGHRNIVVTGRLSENVEKKDFVMLRITDLRIRLFRNGTQIYSFGYDRSTSLYVRSPGNVWHFFASPGIAKDDDIRLEISNVYKKVHYSSVNVLLNEMYSGSPDALYRMVFTKHGFSFVVGIFVFFLGLLELCTALLLLFLKRHKTKDLFYGAAFTISSGIWFSIQFDILPLLVPYPAFIGSLDMYGLYFMGIFFTLYISTYTTGRRRMTLMAYSIFQAVSVIFVEARQLAGRIDVYDTSFYGSISSWVRWRSRSWRCYVNGEKGGKPSARRYFSPFCPSLPADVLIFCSFGEIIITPIYGRARDFSSLYRCSGEYSSGSLNETLTPPPRQIRWRGRSSRAGWR